MPQTPFRYSLHSTLDRDRTRGQFVVELAGHTKSEVIDFIATQIERVERTMKMRPVGVVLSDGDLVTVELEAIEPEPS